MAGFYVFFFLFLLVVADYYFFFSSRRRHTMSYGDWSSDVCFPISRLSADAVPFLVEALPHMTEKDRCIAAAGLVHRWNTEPLDWRSWNWSRARARNMVAARITDLKAWGDPCFARIPPE